MKQKVVLLCLFFLLLFIPTVFWGGTYFIGGDDSKLYYLFPYEYFKNFTTKIVSDNMLGIMGNYFPQLMVSGFSLVIFLTKEFFPFLNMQSFFFGCNLAFGFLCFYALLGLWFKKDERNSFWIKVVASLFYVFSNFTIYSLWQSQLFSMYLVVLFPLALYLFFRGVLEKQIKFVVWNAILMSVFSIMFLSIPWLFAMVLCSIPLLVQLFLKHKKTFILHLFVFLGLTFLLNLYWIFHVAYAPMSSDQQTGLITNLVSSDFRKNNESVIYGVSYHNSLLYPIFGLYHKRIQEDYHWHTLPIYSKWSLPLLTINLLIVGLFLFGLLLHKRLEIAWRKTYLAAVTGWLLALYFFTVNIGSWGMEVFFWMNNTIPAFTMFRNMFDKFGIALSFAAAFLMAFSLKILIDSIQSKQQRLWILVGSVTIILFNALPFISGLFYAQRPLWTTENIYVTVNDFNQDFYALVRYLKAMKEPSRFVWIPWENTNYIEIQDESFPDHYYTGVSPLSFLANTADFTGKLGLPILYGDRIVANLYKDDYQAVGDDFRKLNVEYALVKNEIPREIADSYLYSGGKGSLFDKQGESFRKVFMGKKIKDFGHRYSLYKVNDAFRNEKIYLTKDITKFPEDFSQVAYEKIASHEYRVHIKALKSKENLVFLDAYHQQWDIFFTDGTPFLSGGQQLVFDYANGWEIDPQLMKDQFPQGITSVGDDDSIDAELVLYFRPYKYLQYCLFVSGVVLFLCLGYLFWPLLKAGNRWIFIGK